MSRGFGEGQVLVLTMTHISRSRSRDMPLGVHQLHPYQTHLIDHPVVLSSTSPIKRLSGCCAFFCCGSRTTLRCLQHLFAMSDASMSFITSDPATSQPSLLDAPSNGSGDEVDSLPESETDSDEVTVSESDFGESDAEKEWKESLQQLEMMLTMVLVPMAGKYFGRRFAYWGQSPPSRMAGSCFGKALTIPCRMEAVHGVEIPRQN